MLHVVTFDDSRGMNILINYELTLIIKFKKPLQFVENLLKLFYTTDSMFSALSFDENLKKRYKFRFFGLRITISYFSIALSLSYSLP